MGISDWVAIGALIVAALGWWDSRRRIADEAVKLVATASADWQGEYILHNHGRKKMFFPKIDPEAMKGHRIDDDLSGFQVEPEQPMKFRLSRNQFGRYPDTVTVAYQLSGTGRTHRKHVSLPPVLDSAKPEPDWQL